MAVNLTAIFRVRDQGTARLRRITQMMNRMTQTSHTAAQGMNHYRDANGRLHDSLGRFVAETNRANTSTGLFATRVNGLRVGTNGLSASIGGMQSALIGLAGAYLSAQGAAKAFDMTIGAAARYERSSMAIEGMIGDKKVTKDYLNMVDKLAQASPVLNSTDMLDNSKAFVGMSKNVDELKQVWSLVERAQAFAGVDTKQASFSVKELFQGDYVSFMDAIGGVDKKTLQSIAKMDGLMPKVKALSATFDQMGVGQSMIDKMGNTTLGQWSQIGEALQTLFRDIGFESNTKLGEFLRRINKMFDGIDTEALSNKLGGILGKMTDKAIALYDIFVKWRTQIAYVAGAIGTFLAALAGVGIIAALANPIALIAMGISAAAVGFKALYDNSETFRGIIDGIVGKVKRLATAFNFGGTHGLINALFPPDIAKQVNSVVDGIKSKISGLTEAFKTGGIGGVFDKLFGEGSFETIKTKFEEFRAYATEKFGQLKGVFGRLKETFSQAFSTIADIIKNVWPIIEPYLSGFWNILQVIGDIAMIVFNNVIAPAISFLVQLFSTLWAVAKPILELLGIAWEALSTIIKWAWDNVLAPLVDFILTGVKNALDNFSGALAIVQGWFETLSGWISTAKGHVKDFIGFISNVKLPSWISNGISAGVNFVGNLMGAGDGKNKSAKSHYHGISNVPYDSYYSRLHKGEAVLNRQDAEAYRNGQAGGGISIAKLADSITIREDADIDVIAYKLAKAIEREMAQVS